VVAVAAGLAWLGACSARSELLDPSPAMLLAEAPDSFVAEIETSEGAFYVQLHRSWSPLGVDRAYRLLRSDFYAGSRFYRVLPGFVAQWGFSGDPVLDSVWEGHPIADEPTVESNLRGVVSFARAGAETRSYTLFVNLVDNERLDDAVAGGIAGYPPIGYVIEGIEVVDGFYSAYAEGPSQDSIARQGNEYLRRHFPQLDSIVATSVILEWP
jgi:cyclophilin family peptidyl-prolyl cis-trans isomerase